MLGNNPQERTKKKWLLFHTICEQQLQLHVFAKQKHKDGNKGKEL
jgi:hypothetical protein